jgi:hypothetical protein
MTELKLDPEGYFKFDLGGGGLSYRQGGRLVAYPMDALVRLLATGYNDIQKSLAYTIGLRLGEACGGQLGQVLGDDLLDSDASPESFLGHLNAVLALHGLGTAAMESWGDILLVDWKLGGEGDVHLLEFQEGVLAGVMRRVTGESFEAASIEHDGGVRFILGNATMVDFSKIWSGEGCGLGEIVDRLHAGKHLEGDIQVE